MSINPITMFNQLVGPAVRRQLYCGLCLALLIILIISILPDLIAHLLSAAIEKSTKWLTGSGKTEPAATPPVRDGL